MKKLTNEELLKNFLDKTAKNLYEWSLLLFYYFEVVHCKNIDFPGHYNGYVRQAIKEKADRSFQINSEKLLEANLLNNDFKPHFPKDPQKEWAFGFFLDSVLFEERDEIDLKRKISFLRCSEEYRRLSILYENFYSIQEMLGQDIWNVYSLDILRENVTIESNMLIGYWISKDERIKTSRPGSEARKEKRAKRIREIKTKILERAKITDKGIEISRKDWFKVFVEVFEYAYVSYPTVRDYKEEIAELISDEIGRKVEIIISK